MEQLTEKAQFTTLLENKVLGRVERMRLNPTRRLTNRSRGEHLSGKGGNSTEFSDYRDYVPGDDIRFVDWNIFSRLNRPYMKLFQHEEEMHVVILIDASSSMAGEGKFERAQQLAAALGVMGLLNVERVSIYNCQQTDQAPTVLPPCRGRASMKRFFSFIENLSPGGDLPIDQAVRTVLRHHRGRGVAILLSDFLTFGELNRPFNMLFSAGLEIFAMQILGPGEVDPELTGDQRFVDCETGRTLDISSADQLLHIYQEHRAALENQLSLQCRQRNGRFLSISSQDSLEWVLFDLLRRQGWAQ